LFGCNEEKIDKMKVGKIFSAFAGASSFTPASLSNKLFWYKAGTEVDGQLSTWTDQYSLRNAASVVARNKPSQVDDGGKKAVQFTRTNNEILRASAQTGVVTYTLFVVFRANDTTSNQKICGNGGASDTNHGFDIKI
jgi:hypothetical protein